MEIVYRVNDERVWVGDTTGDLKPIAGAHVASISLRRPTKPHAQAWERQRRRLAEDLRFPPETIANAGRSGRRFR